MKTGPNSQLEIRKNKCPENEDFLKWYKHEKYNDDDLDNEIVHNWQIARKELCNALMDFLLPERIVPDEYSVYTKAQEEYSNGLITIEPVPNGSIDTFSKEFNGLSKSMFYQFLDRKNEKRKLFDNMYLAIDQKLQDIIHNDTVDLKEFYANDLPNWEKKDPETGLFIENDKKYPPTDEFAIEGYVNHVYSVGLDGDFIITPMMARIIEWGVQYNYVAWDTVRIGSQATLEKHLEEIEKRIECINNATLVGVPQKQHAISNSQTMWILIGGMNNEDGFNPDIPRVAMGEEYAGRGADYANGPKDVGVGWIGITNYNDGKKPDADLAGISIPPYEQYDELLSNTEPTSLAYKSNEDWGKLVAAHYYRHSKYSKKDQNNKQIKAADLWYDNEDPTEDELTWIACSIPVGKAGASWESKQGYQHMFPGAYGWVKSFLCADMAYLKSNGNGLCLTSSWLTTWIYAQAYRDKQNKKPYKLEEYEKKIQETFNLPEKAYRWSMRTTPTHPLPPTDFVP